MTLALTINIILSAILFTAIVGSLAWAIMNPRDGRSTAPTKIPSLRGLSTDSTPSRIRTGDFLRERPTSVS